MFKYNKWIFEAMLSDSEKKDLTNQDNLLPNERAKINYRVAQKVKTKLLELKDIDEALCLLPDKNAKKLLNDDLVNDIFTLAEDMIRILGYGPLKIDYTNNDGLVYTTRTEPSKSNNEDDKRKMSFVVTAELANNADVSRIRLIDDHIDVLNHLMSQNFGLYLSDAPKNIASESISGNIDPVSVTQTLAMWGRPRVRTFGGRTITFPYIPTNPLKKK
jgi:hypothetical protein